MTDARSVLLQIKQYEPHLVVLAMDCASGSKFLAEAYKARLTTTRGWLWLAVDDVATKSDVNIQHDVSVKHFRG